MVTFDGDTQEDRRLWHTYLYWARQRVKPDLDTNWTDGRVIIDNRQNRIDDHLGSALQAILFSSFALEYRLKRVLISMNVSYPSKETMAPFLKNFWNRLAKIDRFDRKGKCSPPSEWAKCEKTLSSLVTLRNDIAHANYKKLLSHFANSDP